jgi:amphi-Trp domain-containing protein
MAGQKMELKTTANLLEIVSHLEHLIASLKEGTLCIKKNEKTITLKPAEPVTFELEANSKPEKDALREKLVIELKWTKNEAIAEDKETFSISSQESPEES